ncbi:MAG: hypothetical protein RAO94_03625 [Candidatus Stygibacter australis]|nr:hypothetical protein [Candidatus Stygibacter australis]MDP8321423.1 hypothetical protein [Candidatus Stygibacter australis]
MQENERKFYYYRDLVLCLGEIKGLMVRHAQANWFLEIIYKNGSIMSYECIHKDEAQNLLSELSCMLDAEQIVLKDKF